MSRHERDVLQSLIIENVNLIKSIPQQYFTEVQGIVQRGIQNGRDLGYLTEELDKRYRITRRRAAMIARDQTGKAAESLSRARMQSLGITKGIWIHTSGGKTYRSTHVAMNGKEFDLSKGMYDSAVKDYVFPASLPNCRCTYKPVIPETGGASDVKSASGAGAWPQREAGAAESDTQEYAEADGSSIIQADKVNIPKEKISGFFLKHGAKHSEEFFSVGYTENDYAKLYNDIVSNYDEKNKVDVRKEDGKEDYSVFMYLGVTSKKRFRTVWRKDNENSIPRIITCHRED